MAAILITVRSGTVDWCTYDADDVQVVFVDLDAIDLDEGFEDHIDKAITDVGSLPPQTPWRDATIAHLTTTKLALRAALSTGNPYGEDDEVNP